MQILNKFYKVFDKKSSATHSWSENFTTRNEFAVGAIENKIVPKEELAEELQKPINRKFEKHKVHSS